MLLNQGYVKVNTFMHISNRFTYSISILRWLKYMGESLEDMQDEIEERYRQELSDFLRYTAFFLVVAQKSQKVMESLGPGA